MYFVLSLPWGVKFPGVQYWKDRKIHVYRGSILPKEMRPYASQDFSYERWQEDELNGIVMPPEKGSAKFTPREHQMEAAKKIFKAYSTGQRGFLEADKTGLGKGLAASTPIPTPNGFVSMGDLKVGDTVYGADGKPTKILEKNMSNALKFYKITFSDGTVILADGDHRWLTSNRVERNRKFRNSNPKRRISEASYNNLIDFLLNAQSKRIPVTFEECFTAANSEKPQILRNILKECEIVSKQSKKNLYHPQEVLEKLHKTNMFESNRWGGIYDRSSVKDTNELFKTFRYNTNSNSRSNHSIMNSKAIEGEEKDLPIDPYILGVWLGDGCAHHGTITTMDTEIVDYISKTYPLLKTFENNPPNKSKNYRFKGLQTDLRKVYSWNNTKMLKFIPEEYKNASFNQRMRLLQGLMDTDGAITKKDGAVTFSQKNKNLFDSVYQLICSFGWKATVREKKIFNKLDNENRIYYELIYFPSENVFTISRKKEILELWVDSYKNSGRNNIRYITNIEEIEKTEEYYCISVDNKDHLYLCSHSYIPTHNTLATLSGISVIAKNEGFGTKNKGKLLIVCPKSVIPQWRQTIHNYPIASALLRPMIINYQQLNKLLEAPATARVAKKTRTKNRQTSQKGKPVIDWDYIIFDEAHYLKNYPKSTTSVAAANISKLENKYRKSVEPFVVYSTATPGSTPLNFSIMAGIVAPLLSNSPGAKTVTPSTWAAFLEKEGFAVKKGKSGWTWAPMPWGGKNLTNPEEKRKYDFEVKKVKQIQRRDAQRIGKALIKPNAPFIMRSPKDVAGWPEQLPIPFPVHLTSQQQPIYEEAWTKFRNFLRLTPANKDPKGALVENLRYRQKSSLLKVDAMVDAIEDWVEGGNQVYVSCEFMETIDRYKEKLEAKKITVAELSGRNADENERTQERMRFQKGEAKVILCTVVSGISLHANEILPDGSKASNNTRITLINDIRSNPNDAEQSLGRAHRDGENSVAYFPYLEKTIDEKIVQSFSNKVANMKSMLGTPQEEAEELERMFREAAARTTPPNRLS